MPHALCSTYGTCDHPLFGDLSNKVCSGWCFTLNWLEAGPDGVGATGVDGREAEDSLRAHFPCAGGIAQMPCLPKGHNSSRTFLAANLPSPLCCR